MRTQRRPTGTQIHLTRWLAIAAAVVLGQLEAVPFLAFQQQLFLYWLSLLVPYLQH